jgi:flagellar motility protein MotE (MotC chaperone)
MDKAQEKAVGYFRQSWDAIKLYWTAGTGIVKRGWTISVLAAALTGAGGYILYLNHKNKQAAEEVAKAQSQIVEVQEQSKRLIDQTNDLIKLNQENQAIYEQLQRDREQVVQLVEGFNAQMRANANALSKIGNQVSHLEDGEVAPVLRETVRQVQALRQSRGVK